MSDERKKCPYCSEEIDKTDLVCRHCDMSLEFSASDTSLGSVNGKISEKPKERKREKMDKELADALKRYLESFRRFYFENKYYSQEAQSLLSEKRKVTGIGKKCLEESILKKKFEKCLIFLKNFGQAGQLSPRVMQEYSEYCKDIEINDSDKNALLELFNKGNIPLENFKASLPNGKRSSGKKVIGFAFILLILAGVGYFWCFWEITIKRDGTWNCVQKQSPSTEIAIYKETEFGKIIQCKQCGREISNTVTVEPVQIFKLNDKHVFTSKEYCQDCGNEKIPCTVTWRCERCNKIYNTERYFYPRKEERQDEEKWGVCRSSCRGIPYTVTVNCERCGKKRYEETEYVYYSKNKNPRNTSRSEGYCSNKCRYASNAEKGVDKASEAIGDIGGRIGEGIWKGLNKSR